LERKDSHNQQKGIGAGGPGFVHLVRVEDEVFTQQRGALGDPSLFNLGNMLQFALKPRVGQD
jgi:hypothetical protein